MIEIKRSIARNTIYFTTGKMLGDVCAFVFLVYFARTLGVEVLGKYASAMAFAGLLSLFISMGMNTRMAREVAKDLQQDHMYISNILLTQTVLAALVWFLIVTLSLMFSANIETALIFIFIGSYQVLYQLTMVFYTQFKVHEQMQYPALLELSHKIIILLFGGLLIWLTRDPVYVLAVYPLAALLMLLTAAAMSTRQYGWPEIKPDLAFIKNTIRTSFPFFLLLSVAMVFDRIGIILLSILQGELDTGIYSAADRIVITLLQTVAIFGAIIMPVLSRLSVENSAAFSKLYETSIKLVVGLLLPASLLLSLLAEEIILVVYGEAFAETADVLRILSWLLLAGGISTISATMMIANNGEHILLKVKFFVVSVYIALCLLVIPVSSFIGLSLVKIAAFSGTAIFCIYYLRNLMSLQSVWHAVRAPLFSCVVASITFVIISGVNAWLKAGIFLVSFLMMMYLLRALKLQDIQYLQKILIGR